MEKEARTWESKYMAVEGNLTSAREEIAQLKRSNRQVIDEYMDSEEFLKFIDDHDDDVIQSTTTTAWERAIQTVATKFPEMSISNADFPCPQINPQPAWDPSRDFEIPEITSPFFEEPDGGIPPSTHEESERE